MDNTNICTFDIAPLHSESPLQKRSGMARVLKGFHSFTCTPTRSLRNRNEQYLPFAFLAIAGTHSPTPEGWKAELAWVAGYVVRQFTYPKAVNVAQLR